MNNYYYLVELKTEITACLKQNKNWQPIQSFFEGLLHSLHNAGSWVDVTVCLLHGAHFQMGWKGGGDCFYNTFGLEENGIYAIYIGRIFTDNALSTNDCTI